MNIVFSRASRPALALAALALLAPAPARAWDPDIHVSVARAAVAISAAAEARVPLEHRDAYLKESAEPDFADKECRYHCSSGDPAMEAEKILTALSNPKVVLRPYQRAQMIGRYAHWVMDVVAPANLRQGMAPRMLNFFANQDFVFWRQPRPLAGPLAAALRARHDEAVWANVNVDSSSPALFRLVVNTVADALLLLPPRPEDAKAADTGPVLFLVNRIDNGTAGRATSGEWIKTGHHYSDTYDGSSFVNSSGGWDTWSWRPGSKGGGQSFKKYDLLERKGVQIAELSSRVEGDQVTMRVVFFNNSPMCAAGVALKAEAWSWKLDETMPPHSLKLVEIKAPAEILSKHLGQTGKANDCEGVKIASAVNASRRLVYGNGGSAPAFDAALVEQDITRSSASTKNLNNFTPKNE